MADGDLGNQVELQRDINKLLNQRTKILQKNKRLSEQICKAAKCAREDSKGSADNARELNENMEAGSGPAEDMKDAIEDMADAADDAKGGISGVLSSLGGGAWGAAVGIIGGVASAFQKVFGFLSGMVSMLGSVAGGIWDVGMSIMAIPFDFLNKLIKMAGTMEYNAHKVAEAWEEVRGQFGDLASNEGAALARSMKGFRGEFQKTASQGASFRKIFGFGHEGVAASIKAVLELTTAMGPAFHKLADVWDKKMAVAAVRFTRGMGFSNEAFGALARTVVSRGKDMRVEMKRITVGISEMAKDLQVNNKDIGRAFASMVGNVQEFGHMTEEQMLGASGYVANLGMEIKALDGIMGKFMTMDAVAESAATLAQHFGAVVDMQKVMAAETPVEIIEEFRRAMKETGRSITDMTHAERQALSAATNLTGADLQAAFALENKTKKYKDLKKAADKANKAQKTQKQIMAEMNKGIKKLIIAMTEGGKTFSEFFVRGLGKGIQMSETFRGTLLDIRASMVQTEIAGKRMGIALMNEFPGIKEIGHELRQMFSPKRYQEMWAKVTKGFKKFLRRLSDPKDIQKATRDLFDEILDIAMNFFNPMGSASKIFGEGGLTLMETLGNVFLGAATWVFNTLLTGVTTVLGWLGTWLDTEGWRQIVPFFVGMWTNIAKYAADALSGKKSPFMEVWEKNKGPLFKAWDELVIAFQKEGGLGDQIAKFFKDTWKKVKKVLIDDISKWWEGVDWTTKFGLGAGVMGYALASVLLPAISTALGIALAKGTAMAMIGGAVTTAVTGIGVAFLSVFGMTLGFPVLIAAGLATAFALALEKWGPGGAKDMKKAAEKSGKALAEGLDKGYRDELKKGQQPMIDAFTDLSKTLRGVATVEGISAAKKAAAKKQLLAAHSELEGVGKQRAALLRAIKAADKNMEKYDAKSVAIPIRNAHIWARAAKKRAEEELKELEKNALKKRDAFRTLNKKWLRELEAAGISEHKVLYSLGEGHVKSIKGIEKERQDIMDGVVDGNIADIQRLTSAILKARGPAQLTMKEAAKKAAESGVITEDQAHTFFSGVQGYFDRGITLIGGTRKKLQSEKKSADKLLEGLLAGPQSVPGAPKPKLDEKAQRRLAKKEMEEASKRLTAKFGKEVAAKIIKKQKLAKEAEAFLKGVNVEKLLEANQIIVAARRINRNKKFIKRAKKTAINMGKDVDKLAGAMVKMSVKLDHAVSRGSKDAVKKVGKVVASLREMQSMLAGVGTVPIDVLIDNFAKASLPGGGKVGDEARSAAGGKVKINVNVYMEARQLVSEMTLGNPVDAERIRPSATCGMDDL